MRLIGQLRLQKADWDLAEYRSLFHRLGDIAESGKVTRIIRYSGEVGGHTEVRFFGIETESENIPESMEALELGENSFSITETGKIKPVVSWSGKLKWGWLDRTKPDTPVGDFTVNAPASWNLPEQAPLEFVMSANSYFDKARAYDDDVRLVEYDPSWPGKFKEMADRLRKTIPPEIVRRVEHYGSTAIPGMPAKPIIDILLEVPSFQEARQALIPLFNRPECEYWWYGGHMEFILRKELMGTRLYHIHAAPAGHQLWQGLAFRDYLRTHPEDAGRYAELKYKLAESHAADREEYTIAKSNFVNEITERALENNQ